MLYLYYTLAAIAILLLVLIIEFKRPISHLLFRAATPHLIKIKKHGVKHPSVFEQTDPSLWIAESENAFAIKDIRPRAPHHYLVIPKERKHTLLDTDTELLGEMLELCKAVAKEAGIDEKGFRIVINTNPHGLQTVYHLHIHVLGGRQMQLPIG